MTESPPNPPDAAPGLADDLALMRSVASGDRHGERAFVDRYLTRVRRTAGALLRNPAEADDATQLALLELLDAASSFQARGSLDRWVDRIVVRTTLRHARREARRQRGREVDADPDALSAAATGPHRHDGEAFRSLADDEIHLYLDQLSEPRRTALVLRHVLGHSVPEIAELTGVSVNTVKDRLLTARDQFRKLVRRDRILGKGSRRMA